jgi:hypothetical protein
MATALRNLDVSMPMKASPHDSPSLFEALPGPFRLTLVVTSRVSRLFKKRTYGLAGRRRAAGTAVQGFARGFSGVVGIFAAATLTEVEAVRPVVCERLR